jgi:hypothetical protein
MKNYQIFATSAALLIVANYWFLVSSSPLIPRLADYAAYGFFIYGIYQLTQGKK